MFTKAAGSAVVIVAMFYAIPIYSTDNKLKIYVDEVFNIIDSECPVKSYFRPNHVEIRFGNLPGDIIGLCDTNVYRYIVTIKESFWDRSKDSEKFELMAHEITHCALGLDHSMDSHNYMYARMTDSPSRDEVTEQLRENARNYCQPSKRGEHESFLLR